jgi:uncharacterized spore protein YtfJ
MDIQDLLCAISERLSASATVNNVYGNPVVVDDRTVIPIARVRYAFGGGGGSKGDAGAQNEGGGGKVAAEPCGALDITREGTRFIAFSGQRTLLAAFGVGFALGALVVALTKSQRIEIVKRAAGREGLAGSK